MSNQHKVTTVGKAGQYWGVAVAFDGLSSHTTGPYPTRMEARREIEDVVENQLGGTEFHRIKKGLLLPSLKAVVGGEW